MEKTQRSKAPNLCHYYDSKLAVHALIHSDNLLYTIHDEYLLDLRLKHRLYNDLSIFFERELGTKGILKSVVI